MDEQIRSQMIVDLQLQKSLDSSWAISQHEVIDVLQDMNERYMQYKKCVRTFLFRNLILQTIQDFKKWIIPLQAKKLDISKPVFSLKDGTMIFAHLFSRQDYQDARIETVDPEGFSQYETVILEAFSTEKMKEL